MWWKNPKLIAEAMDAWDNANIQDPGIDPSKLGKPASTSQWRTPTSVQVSVLNLSEVLEYAKTSYAQHFPEKAAGLVGLKPHAEKVGYAKVKSGLYVIDSEGVGALVTKSKPFKLALFADFKDEDGQESFSIVADLVVTLTADLILTMPVSRTENLCAFIRTFGNRLDANYEMWKAKLEASR